MGLADSRLWPRVCANDLQDFECWDVKNDILNLKIHVQSGHVACKLKVDLTSSVNKAMEISFDPVLPIHEEHMRKMREIVGELETNIVEVMNVDEA